MKLLDNIKKETKTSVIGGILFLAGFLDLWLFNKLEGEWMGIPYDILGIVAGALLLISPDAILGRFGKKKSE